MFLVPCIFFNKCFYFLYHMAGYFLDMARTRHILFIHSSVGGHLGRFHLLAIVNNANMDIQITNSLRSCFQFFWIYVYPEVGLPAYVILLLILRNDHTVSGCTVCFHHQGTRAPISLHLCRHCYLCSGFCIYNSLSVP